jgi:hypothetical protein
MTASSQGDRARWTIQEAERLLLSLKGVLSARLVTRPGGEVEEIHLVTTEEVSPKQTVRNVESALLASLDLPVDHRKISVAQTKEVPPSVGDEEEEPAVRLLPEAPATETRILFHGHQVETERSHQVRHRVEIEWKGERYAGTAAAADLPRGRLEAVTKATLSAVEAAVAAEVAETSRPGVTLALDGVKIVHAFDCDFVLVAVHAMAGRDVAPLAGATVVESSSARAAILAALQATDRWVRGHV